MNSRGIWWVVDDDSGTGDLSCRVRSGFEANAEEPGTPGSGRRAPQGTRQPPSAWPESGGEMDLLARDIQACLTGPVRQRP